MVLLNDLWCFGLLNILVKLIRLLVSNYEFATMGVEYFDQYMGAVCSVVLGRECSKAAALQSMFQT